MAKLTQKQWDKIKARLDAGDKAADLAREYGIGRSAITNKFGEQKKKAIELANQIVAVERNLSSVNKSVQIDAFTIAQNLLAISDNFAEGARLSSLTFRKLTTIAHTHAKNLKDDNEDPEALALVMSHQRSANEALKPVTEAINANKTAMERAMAQSGETTEEGATSVLADIMADYAIIK
jgi:hypothetical protein